MPVTNKPFPVGLVNHTPATVRQAFWGSPTLKAEFSSAPGSMNITSILTHVIQVVGRFSERFASDVLYDIDRIRELVDCKYDLDRDFDEIVVIAARRDGVDGESFFMSRLKDTARPFPGSRGLWDAFVHVEATYRQVLGVRIWAKAPSRGDPGRMGCELRDMTNSFLRMNRADFGPDGKLLDMPYPDGNPIALDYQTGEPLAEPVESRDRGLDGRKTCHMDITENAAGALSVSCTACRHTFDTDYVGDPDAEAVRIAMGAFMYCPSCGAAYGGCRINGKDFTDCPPKVQKKLMDKMPRPKANGIGEK